jgi:uncharacterized protein YwqG
LTALHPTAEVEARAAIEKSRFAAEVEAILRGARPIIRIDPLRRDVKRYRSWFGGEPSLPEDVPWPVWDPTSLLTKRIERLESKLRERPDMPEPKLAIHRKRIAAWQEHLRHVPRPLQFLGQVNVEGAGEALDALHLPRTGTFWFFVEHELFSPFSPSCWRVIYRDMRVEETKHRPAPAGTSVYRHTPVAARPGLYLLHATELVFKRRAESNESLSDAWSDLHVKLHNPHGRLYTMGDRRTGSQYGDERVRAAVCRCATRGDVTLTPEEEQQVIKDSQAWRCLLHVESDFLWKNGPGFTWGDEGAMTFWLHEDAWERREFDKAWAYVDAT